MLSIVYNYKKNFNPMQKIIRKKWDDYKFEKIKNTLPWREEDFITGNYRGISRTLYRVVGFPKHNKVIIQEIALSDGLILDRRCFEWPLKDAVKEYRKATKEELINYGVIPNSLLYIED